MAALASIAPATFPDLKGKVFAITGGASGIGKAIALQLAQQGAKVGLLDIKTSQPVVDEITALKNGSAAINLIVDVRDVAAVDRGIQAVVDKFGRLDGAANMAGIMGRKKLGEPGNSVEALKDDDWDDVLETNLDGVKNCMRAEIRQMQSGSGSIVNATAFGGQRGVPYLSPYCASQFGIIGLTKCAALEVAKKGVRINAVAPGLVETPLLFSLGDPLLLEVTLTNRIAMKRFGKPEEIARVVVFLLSDQASYVTASIINVDGGYQ